MSGKIDWVALREQQRQERDHEKRVNGGLWCPNCLTRCPPTRARGECVVCNALRDNDPAEYARIYAEAYR